MDKNRASCVAESPAAADILVSADPPPQNLLGRWRSIETSKGGIGSMLTFHSNGVVDFSPGAVVEMTYRIAGSQLILPPATNTGPELRQQMEFRGANQLRLITKVDGQVAITGATVAAVLKETGLIVRS